MKTQNHSPIADVQGRSDSRAVSIHKVGIKGIRHPFIIAGDNTLQHTVATCNLYVNLTADQKGTHMSRFVEILNDFTEPLTLDSLHKLVKRTVAHLHAENAYLEFSFPYFLNKSAPVSGVKSLLDYNITLKAESVAGETQVILQVNVPVASLCPCSKEISKYGAHNQRSEVCVTLYQAQDLWIDEIITIVEQQASCELYGLLKRPDEKYVTERAYENPKFVEDMVRDIAAVLNADSRVTRYQVTAENFESIHNHSAFAQIDS
jgi:GTP cyclohydrolase I